MERKIGSFAPKAWRVSALLFALITPNLTLASEACETFEMLGRRADRGDAAAQAAVSHFHLHGMCGFKKSLVQAYKWAALAIERGNDSEKQESHFRRLEENMSDEELSKAKQLVRDWRPK